MFWEHPREDVIKSSLGFLILMVMLICVGNSENRSTLSLMNSQAMYTSVSFTKFIFESTYSR